MTTNPATDVDLRGPAEESKAAKAVRTSGDATAEKGWVSDVRNVDNTEGTITSFDGKKFTYPLEGSEYQIEQARAKAVDKANKHFETTRGSAQHDFDNEKLASEQTNPV